MRTTNTAVTIVGEMVGALVGALALFLCTGWLFMLFLGAAHSYDAVIPALSFWGACWLSTALIAVTGTGAAVGASA